MDREDDVFEGLNEAELRQKLDSAGTYEERSKLRAALRRLRESGESTSSLSSSTQQNSLITLPADGSSTSLTASATTSTPERATYKRPGYQVQRDPPLHYGVRHWESVDAVPALARRLSESQKRTSVSDTSAYTSATAAGSGRRSSSRSGVEAPQQQTTAIDTETPSAQGEGPVVVSTNEARRCEQGSEVTMNGSGGSDTTHAAVNGHHRDAARESSSPDLDGGRETESGYRSESRMSTSSFRSEGGESFASADSVQSDLELEESIQRQIEASKDYGQRKRLRARLRQVQQRRMSKCQMTATPDGGRRQPSQDVVTPDDVTNSKTIGQAAVSKDSGEESQPSWVKLARRMSNPNSMTERKKSFKREEKATGGSEAEEVYKSVSLRSTGRLSDRTPTPESDQPPSSLRAESPYKSVQLKKTGVLDGSASMTSNTRRASSSSTEQPESPYKSVQLKKTGAVLDATGDSGFTRSTSRQDNADPAIRPESPYKSVELKKTGVLDSGTAGATVSRRHSVGKRDEKESPYNVSLRKTGRIEAESPVKRRSSISAADKPAAAAYEPQGSGIQAPTSPTYEVKMEQRSSSGSSIDDRGSIYSDVSLRKTGALSSSRARRSSINEDPRLSSGSTASDDKKTGASPWQVALKKTVEPGRSSTLPRNPSASSSSSTVGGVVDYLSVLRKRKQSSETTDGSAAEAHSYTPTGSGQTRTRTSSSSSETLGSDYLSVLRRKKTDGGSSETGGSAYKPSERSTPSRTETPDYRSALRRSVHMSDKKVLDDFGRPRSTSPSRMDYRSILRGKQEPEPKPTHEDESASSELSLKSGNGPAVEPEPLTNGCHTDEIVVRGPKSPVENVYLPGGIRISDPEETDL